MENFNAVRLMYMADYWHKTLENEHRLFCFLLKGEESQKQRRFGVLLDFSTKNNEDLNSFFFLR